MIIYRWSTTGVPEVFLRTSNDDAIVLSVQPGDVYSLEWDRDSDFCNCNCEFSIWIDNGDNTYTIPSSGIVTDAFITRVCDPYMNGADAPQLRNHFDVWLTPDGHANICENKWN